MQADDQCGGRGVGGLALRLVLALLQEIEIVAGQLGLRDQPPGLFADTRKRQAGRNHHRLLRAAHHDIEPPLRDAQLGGAEAGDGVNHERGFGIILYRFAERAHVVHHGSGSFRRLDEHGAERAAGRELLLHRLNVHRLAVGRLHLHRLDAVGLRESQPALAELASRADQHTLARREEVGQGAFHGARAGARENQHVVLGIVVVLQQGERFRQNLPKRLGAMVNIGCCECARLCLHQQRSGAGSEESFFD